MSIAVRQMIMPQSIRNKLGISKAVLDRIVVHNTSNDASANNEISYMNRGENPAKVSYHFAIDDKEVVQGLPLDVHGWHAGDGSSGAGNKKGIGVEICYSKSGGARFDAAEILTAKFIAQLLKERGCGIERVTKHQDYSGKYCPHRTLDNGWQRFLNLVKSYMAVAPAQPTNPAPDITGGTTYTVVKSDTLSGIAKKFGTTVKALQDLNKIADPNKISIGQKIKIPQKEPNMPPAPTAKTVKIKAGKWNVRATCSTSGKILRIITGPQTVSCSEKMDGWLYLPAYGGWIGPAAIG